MPELPKLIIVGAGGLGAEIAAAAKHANSRSPTFEILGFCDDSASKAGVMIDGLKVLGTAEEVDRTLSTKPRYICAIGNNRIRKEMAARMTALGWQPASVIDPSVVRAESATIGPGSYAAAGVVLSPFAQVGSHVVMNFGCSVTHNVQLEDFSQVAPGARISGFGVVQTGAFVASNAVVAPGVSVGAWATLAACSFALHDVPAGATVMGIPAQVVFRSTKK
jgi:sugar O-acyltransferase (sialic acid O-acetyltransferase NeuD family)